MGFWSGVERGLGVVRDQKEKDKDRAERAAALAESRAIEERRLRLAEDAALRNEYQFSETMDFRRSEAEAERESTRFTRQLDLIKARGITSGSTGNGTKDVTPAGADLLWLRGRLKGAEGSDVFLEEAYRNPTLATETRSVIEGAEKKAQNSGYEKSLEGSDILRYLEVISQPGGDSPSVSTDDILSAESDDELLSVWQQMLSETPPVSTLNIDSDIHMLPDTTLFKTQNEFLDGIILDLIEADLQKADSDIKSGVVGAEMVSAALMNSRDEYIAGEPGMVQSLQTTYGVRALEELSKYNNLGSIRNNPYLARVAERSGWGK